ncbi:hypothetical protein BC938DRAFT_471997 [Jimgerdemannia flammicorona]|uniref:Uncharacterized protein n=1 Tax=Jimgerdemannia flammicorona TaxID=994334 RepID=A0A433Q6Z5_9FUNG|nr:hypothetical protein BC938DRAFT_471997 [Jimgerdemannia flammicorona]
MSDTSSSSLSDLPDGFRIIHDRRFHNGNKYMLPNDEREVSRLDLQHYVMRLTKPGGWVELFELACTPERAPADVTALHGLTTLSTAKGIDHTEIWRLKPLLMAHNFHNVESDYISCPLGWGGRVGETHVNNIHLAYLAMGPVVAPVLGVDQDEYSAIVQRMVDGFKGRKTWHKAPYVYGTKPV